MGSAETETINHELPPNITAASEIGTREYQEDRHLAEAIRTAAGEFDVLAVMDGHGGVDTAERVSSVISTLLARNLDQGLDTLAAIQKAFKTLHELTRTYTDGTVVSLVLVPKETQEAYVAILGDAPVIIKDKDGNINISPQHNVRTNEGERQAALSRGAEYMDIGYIIDPLSGDGLQMSRALGDRKVGRVLDRNPEVYKVELGADSFIVVASDGIFDPSHHQDTDQEVHRIAELVASGANARELVDDALARETGDNATAVVWRPLV